MSRFTDIRSFQRQIHLDFHTSPLIPDVASEFDPREFARTMKRAHVNSVTMFAKCHHGMCYYPTKSGRQHPALNGRDMMGEMIEALHSEGIRAPIYTTVAWEEDVADRFPQWRQMNAAGKFCYAGPHPGAWKFNNYLHPDYQDYIEAHLREILTGGYEVDGLFLDILFMAGDACWSPQSVRFREKRGLMGTDKVTRDRFETATQVEFCRKFTRIIRSLNKDCSIFYNAPNPMFVESSEGFRAREKVQTHYELESLPSGFWGYFHFPRLGRLTMGTGEPWLGMTGRFQRMWGDFGGIKPVPALEYETFRCQALGGMNSVGDQLPPRGKLDQAAYDLIGEVYAQCETAEPFYENSKPLPQVGIVVPGYAGLDWNVTDQSLEGAVQLCDEAHYDCIVLDDSSDLASLDAVILPDSVTITPKLAAKLKAYRKAGGKLILSCKSGLDLQGKLAIDLPLTFEGECTSLPTYWRSTRAFDVQLSKSDRVLYERGMDVMPQKDGAAVLIQRVRPYFNRTDATYCSHFQTPPMANADKHPAVIGGEGFIYFADPIFREYRKVGSLTVKQVFHKALRQLIGAPQFGDGLPSTILMVPRRRKRDLLLTLLHYVPLRKSMEIDVIDERMSFAGETLRLPAAVKEVRLHGGDVLKQIAPGEFALPTAKGRLLLEVPGYF